MPSIIPSPGAPPGPANVSSTIQVTGNYVVASGSYLYGDPLQLLLLGSSYSSPYPNLTNNGTIWIRGAQSAQLLAWTYFGQITNEGLAVAEASNGAAIAFHDGASLTGLANSGDIYALATGGRAIGIETIGGGAIVNSGLIAAGSDQQARAITRIYGGRVVNAAGGEILAEGADAVAIYLGREHFTAGPMGLPDIDNAGRIEAVSTNVSAPSIAIDLIIQTNAIGVRNSGIIRADVAIRARHGGDTPAGATITNLQGGIIEGSVLLSGRGDVIVNAGSITGLVQTADGNDSLDTTSGQLVGVADLGWGDDLYYGGAGSDAVVGGRQADQLFGNGGNDLLLGGREADRLTGGAGNDGLYGEEGNDFIQTLGSDRALAGAGDDRVMLGDYAFELADGGAGFDELILPISTKILDLSAALASGRLAGFEAIRIQTGQEIIVRPDDAAQLTGGTPELIIHAGALGRVHLVGDWTPGALHPVAGIQYRYYTSGATQLLIADDAIVTIAAAPPPGGAGLDALLGGGAAPLPGSVPGADLNGNVFAGRSVFVSLTIEADEIWQSTNGMSALGGGNPLATLVNYGTVTSVGGTEGATAAMVGAFASFENFGTISASAPGNGADMAFKLNGLATYGLSSTVTSGFDPVYGLRQTTGYFTPVRNAGTITATTEFGTAIGHGADVIDLLNTGTISALSTAFIAVGVYASGGSLINEGTIEAEGEVAAVGILARSNYQGLTIDNRGLITADVHQAGKESVGVLFSGQSGYWGTIVNLLNSGIIAADVAIESRQLGSETRLVIVNSGEIDGRIHLDADSAWPGRASGLINQGVITGEVRLGGERDIYHGLGGEQNGAVLGEGGSDLLFGTSAADTLSGGNEADLIVGGGGGDSLAGGAGGDVFLYAAVGDSSAASLDTIGDFQTGLDRIDLSALNVTAWSLTPDGQYTLLTATTATGTLTVRISGAVAESDLILAPAAQRSGTAGADLLVASSTGTVLDGLEGDDVLVGGAGNDRLSGGSGSNLFWGGAGDDVFVIAGAGEMVWELAGEGTDTAEYHGSGFSVLPENVENLVLVSGSSATGNALDNVITGNGQANFIDGGAGADLMIGGLGNDQYRVDRGNDVVLEDLGAGTDLVLATASFTLGDHVENLTLEGSADLAGGGNGQDNRIIGNGGANAIDAGGGADLVNAGAGDDRIRGEAGADQLFGEYGEDVIDGGEGNDLIQGGGHADRIDGGAGDDTIHADTPPRWDPISWTYRPPDAVDFLGVDVLIGGAGADQIHAGSGVDQIVYLAASDSTSASQDRIRSFLSGTDKVDLSALEVSSLSWSQLTDPGDGSLYSLVSVVTPQGTMAIRIDGAVVMADFILADPPRQLSGGSGDDLLTGGSGRDQLAGNGGHDALYGLAGADSLTGNDGFDYLDGGAGADTMAGGAGSDSYVVDSADDSVVELAGEGSDLILTALAQYSLAGLAHVEKLSGLGNVDQVLTGNGADNVIDGGQGADAMAGGLGNDIYIVDNAGDTVTELASQGSDEVRTSLLDYSIAALTNVEKLTGIGTSSQTLTGNNRDNVIDGGQGGDAMAGGAGDDIYIVDNLLDVVTELAGEGSDEIRTSLGSKAPPDRLVYVLPDFVENLTGTSAGAQGVRDNSLDNVITMGSGHDLIVADSGGVDTINAGAGNDFIYHGDKLTADDVTDGGAGTDTISLLGDYGAGITFTATNLMGVERMALYTSLYSPGTGPNNYTITMHDSNVAAGTEFFVTAASLQSTESLVFNGSAETGGRFTIHGGQGADTIIGGAGADFFLGNAGNDTLYGLGGMDFLIGGLGADQLRGGGAADRFVYQSTAQSTTGSVDRILDFQHADRIDLSAIDANANAGDGNSAFTFIGSNAFGNVAGQLRAYQSGNDWFVEGDVNGDGLADLVIQLTLVDPAPLGAGDFIL